MKRWLIAAFASLVMMPAYAAERPDQKDVWDIVIGTPVTALSEADFQEYACGTKGGPPSTPLTGWRDYARCPADELGLHEVHFRYEDEAEYWARANRLQSVLHLYSGTRVFGYDAIVSALIDSNGILSGLRVVTDQRVNDVERGRAWTMRRFAKARFGRDAWECVDLPMEDRDEPVGKRYIREVCNKVWRADTQVTVKTNLRRKPGQFLVNPQTGKLTEGYFESFTLLEIVKTSPSESSN
ncbi:MAG: hypothetical protein O2995_13835 [Proteobacteria bacterium]|nr:hypothetical protein [Pseudomonadota bacterium]